MDKVDNGMCYLSALHLVNKWELGQVVHPITGFETSGPFIPIFVPIMCKYPIHLFNTSWEFQQIERCEGWKKWHFLYPPSVCKWFPPLFQERWSLFRHLAEDSWMVLYSLGAMHQLVQIWLILLSKYAYRRTGSTSSNLKSNLIQNPSKYLGINFKFRGNKVVGFQFLIKKLNSKLQGWKAKFLSQAGRTTLISSVLLSLPPYTFSCFRVFEQVCNKMDAIVWAF